jgi:hypothetical protein
LIIPIAKFPAEFVRILEEFEGITVVLKVIWAADQAPPVPGTTLKLAAGIDAAFPFNWKFPVIPVGHKIFNEKFCGFVRGKVTISDPAQFKGGKISEPNSQP